MTWVHFGRDQICTKVDASFLPLTHPPHVIPMWVKFICCKGNLLANERQPWTPWNGVLLAICLYLRVPMANQRKSALKFDWRPLASPSLASAYRRSKALGKPWSTKNYSLTLPQWKSLSHMSSHDQPRPGSFSLGALERRWLPLVSFPVSLRPRVALFFCPKVHCHVQSLCPSVIRCDLVFCLCFSRFGQTTLLSAQTTDWP